MEIETDEMERDRSNGGDRKCQHCQDTAVESMAWRGSDGELIITGYCQDCYDDIRSKFWDKPDGATGE